ncbi:unnamed protein product [Blepharisma stoltei]|uniref:Uncharacterized protein n=1 Tax=Blepharisma stoltei TaxID=1481888 RepID=A0AAU9JE74_9CILI|nr:unnamed protein product [Blepharisma stoltei]
MKAEPNPNKINNQFNDRVSSSNLTLGRLLKQLKAESTTSSRSSTTSLCGDQLLKFRELYQNLESGSLTKDKFSQAIREDPQFKPNNKFDKVLENPHRTYTELLNTVRAPQETTQSGFFDNPRCQRFLSSSSLTTLGSQRLTKPKIENPESSIRDVNYDELSDKIKLYSCGGMDRSEFMNYLSEKHIPITLELERDIREHETTKSVGYQRIGRCIFNSLNQDEATTRLAGNPNQKDPNTFRYLSNPNVVQGTPVTKEKMKEELLQKEYDKVGTGMYVTHKGKAKPTYQDNGELTVWNPEKKVQTEVKELDHLKSSDFFTWQGDVEDNSVSRKAKIDHVAAQNSGNFIGWRD